MERLVSVDVCVFVCVCVSEPSDPFFAPSQEWKNRDFSKDTWLEAVNPLVPSEVCVAKVTQVKGRLMWLRLEGKRDGDRERVNEE